MATTSDTKVILESLEKDHSAPNADLQEVIIDSAERQLEGDEPLQDGVQRPPRAFDYVELPPGVAVSLPCSSESGLQRLWEGGLFDLSVAYIWDQYGAVRLWHKLGSRRHFLPARNRSSVLYIIFAWTGSPWYIYGTVSLILLIAIYAGHYRARIRRRFNIIGSEGDDVVSTIDDHLYHIMCGCCSLCQEARTLKHNNVHNGVWHGRGDILVIGSQVVFSPNCASDLALNGMRRHPSWRKMMSKIELPIEPASLETGDHSWIEQLPLIKHG